jgi:hypothetical protein
MGGVRLEIDPPAAVEIEGRERDAPGPPTGWSPTLTVDFLVRAPARSVANPARLTFTLDEGLANPESGLGVFFRAVVLGACTGPEGQADPDPCIESRDFLDDGRGQIVVLASNPST